MILPIIALVISALAVIVTLLIYRRASAPNIVVYLDSRSGSDVVIVVENTGRNAAYDITFSSERNSIDDVLAPITCLVPNQKLTFLWGSYRELRNDYENRVISVNVKYFRSSRTMRMRSNRYFSLDIAILGRSLAEQNDLELINSSLEDINKTLYRINDSLRNSKGIFR